MKKQVFSFLLIISFVFSVSAQTMEARKVYEFGNTNCDDFRASLDILLTELNNSLDSKGYVFVYEGDLETFIYDKNGVNKGKKLISSEKGFARILIGYFTFKSKPLLQMPRILENKWYVDEIYNRGIVDPITSASREGLWKIFDVGLIDGVVNGMGAFMSELGNLVRRVQAGYVRSYAAFILLGALVVISYFVYYGLKLI
jgi:NADH:ubiquinone oxidoreductase subunit 5 (subunit L)/multisubunit Na+/H+ antiporter MnhA subunit